MTFNKGDKVRLNAHGWAKLSHWGFRDEMFFIHGVQLNWGKYEQYVELDLVDKSKFDTTVYVPGDMLEHVGGPW